jgi:hypothetical protein
VSPAEYVVFSDFSGQIERRPFVLVCESLSCDDEFTSHTFSFESKDETNERLLVIYQCSCCGRPRVFGCEELNANVSPE